MAKYSIEDTTLTNIADAIRSKQKPETEKIETAIETKVSKTPNATGFDSYSGSYSNNLARTDTVTITGATTIKVKIAYQTESTSYDYVNITPGVGTAINKLGGPNRAEAEYEFPGTNTVTFRFISDSSNGNYLGYYAEVTGYTVEEVELPLPEYTPVEMAGAIEELNTGGINAPTLCCYLSANFVEDKIDTDANWTSFKSYIKDPVYSPTSKYTTDSGIGDSGTGLKYRLSGFTKMNQIGSVDNIKAIYFWNSSNCYFWIAGMPYKRVSSNVISMSCCHSYYNSSYSKGYITASDEYKQFGVDLNNNYFYQSFTSSISYYQMMIIYED